MADEQNVNDAKPAIDTLCDEADALHRAGRLEDAVALLTRDTSSHLLARADEGMGRDYAEQSLSRAHKNDLSIGIRGAKAALAAIA